MAAIPQTGGGGHIRRFVLHADVSDFRNFSLIFSGLLAGEVA